MKRWRNQGTISSSETEFFHNNNIQKNKVCQGYEIGILQSAPIFDAPPICTWSETKIDALMNGEGKHCKSFPRGHMVYLNSKFTCPLCQRTRRWPKTSPSPEERGKVSALLTDEGWISAQELSLNTAKLEMIGCIILFVLSFSGAHKMLCLVLSQVATLIRRLRRHLPPIYGGRTT